MKNLRIARKNPSKILKIIDIHPATYRYASNTQQNIPSIRPQNISFAYNSKQHKNILSHRDSSLKHSPSRSQRAIQTKSNSKNKKIRNRSLGSSQQAIKNEGVSAVLMRFRNSHQNHPKQQHSPYIKRPKLRESQKLLNFHSVSLGDKMRKQEKLSKEKQSLKNVTKKRSTQIKFQHSQDFQNQQSYILENAKVLLGKGQYRKSLLLVKNVLQNHPNHLEALYLSAVNWYNLEDRVKTILFLQQIFEIDASYSAQCYKMAAVCYSKLYQYNKSLICLSNCHKQFPQEVQSYQIQGKILSKSNKWQEAAITYQCGYQISKNPSFLLSKAACHEQLNQISLALQCYQSLVEIKQFDQLVLLRKLSLHKRLYQFQEIVSTYEIFGNSKYQIKPSIQRDELYYLVSYAYYKLHKYSCALIAIDQGINNCINPVNFHKLLLMIRIHQRDIYQAIHLVTRIKETNEPLQIKTIMKFVQGVIELMRRNYDEGINILLTLQNDLGFKIDINNTELEKEDKGKATTDQFLNQIRSIFLMFLSFGYYSISQFKTCRKLLKIQEMIGVPEYFQIGFLYNLQMCQGIIFHCDKDFIKAEAHFLKALTMYDNKLEPPFSLALNCLQIMVNAKADERKQLAAKSNKYFQSCQKIVGKQTTNTAAGVYYFSSLLHGYMEQWKEALDCIDESIERSEDHYWRYFYVRALLLACIHSFKQAINDLSLAIALAGTTRPQCYLLRSKCLQIEGEGNEAFKDLQEYISLKPDDPEVHKFAGQLLFQNGAFEDALVAFSHQPIQIKVQNYDIFMTQGKSLFLLGRFSEAYALVKQAQQLKYLEEVQMDLQVLQILDLIAKKSQSIEQIEKRLENIYKKYNKLGKIFRMSDYHILKAVCYVYRRFYEAAIPHFTDSIQQKSLQLGQSEEENESGIIENRKDLNTFTNQMKYNVVLCRMLLGQRQEAISIYKTITVDIDQPFYGDYLNFKKFLNREVQTYKKQDVFPSRNKLSNFLEKVQLTSESKNKQKIVIPLKLCIPFPKVQPPQIFPTFDQNLLSRLSVLNVQRKPQAPWVVRQNKSIKFTDKIDTFSHFELQDSENESSSTYQMISVDQSHIDPSRLSKRLKTSAIKIVGESRLSKNQQ